MSLLFYLMQRIGKWNLSLFWTTRVLPPHDGVLGPGTSQLYFLFLVIPPQIRFLNSYSCYPPDFHQIWLPCSQRESTVFLRTCWRDQLSFYDTDFAGTSSSEALHTRTITRIAFLHGFPYSRYFMTHLEFCPFVRLQISLRRHVSSLIRFPIKGHLHELPLLLQSDKSMSLLSPGAAPITSFSLGYYAFFIAKVFPP